jgi:hypothetical protein
MPLPSGGAFEQALVFCVKLTGLIVLDHPNSADSLAADVEGHQEPFDQQRMNAGKLLVVPMSIGE